MLSLIIKLFVLLQFFPLYTSFNVNMKNRQKTMLVVVAHPDDEMAVAEVLVKFNRHGFKVILMIATDGKYGTRVTQIPEGDSLAKVRREESICSSEKMGIEHPIFLSIDRLDTKNGVRSYFNAHKQLRDSLTKRIRSINLDFIITFGPDGDSHHAEHIVVGEGGPGGHRVAAQAHFTVVVADDADRGAAVPELAAAVDAAGVGGHRRFEPEAGLQAVAQVFDAAEAQPAGAVAVIGQQLGVHVAVLQVPAIDIKHAEHGDRRLRRGRAGKCSQDGESD